MIVRTVTIGTCLLLAAVASAQPSGRRGPPPEAFEACESKSDGDACGFSGRRGEVSGQCRTPPNTQDLVCVPDGPPPRDRPSEG